MTNETDSFVQEVDESLRQDRLLDLAKRYGPTFIGAFLVMIAIMFGWQQYTAFQLRQGREHAETYAAAQRLAGSGNAEAAKAEFARLSEEGPHNYRVMARMEHAAVLELDGDLEAALREFDLAASDAKDPILRETAQLRAAYIVADTQDFQALQRRLQPLIETNTPLSFLARELLGIEAWEAGQTDLARQTLQGLTLAFNAPNGVRERAQVALEVIGPAAEAPADGAASAPAPSEGETK